MSGRRRNWAKAHQRRALKMKLEQPETVGVYGTPIKLRREPESYFHKPITDQPKPVTLPRVKWLDRPDP